VNFYAKRKEIGVEEGLKDIPGVTTRMLIAFGKHGIMSIEDLADCATDDLNGWSETKDGKTIRHTGILGRFKVLRRGRVKATACATASGPARAVGSEIFPNENYLALVPQPAAKQEQSVQRFRSLRFPPSTVT
jgi:hypothetical protein